MSPKAAFLFYLGYVAAVVILTLVSGPDPEVAGIPLNTLILSLGLLLTPLPTWILVSRVRTEDGLAQNI